MEILEKHKEVRNPARRNLPQHEMLKRENSEQVKDTSTERLALKLEKKQSIVYKKKLLKEQKCHDKQMEFIAHEQVSRERSQRLKSERFTREFDRTNRDITNLQVLLKLSINRTQSMIS
eukprot:395285_1